MKIGGPYPALPPSPDHPLVTLARRASRALLSSRWLRVHLIGQRKREEIIIKLIPPSTGPLRSGRLFRFLSSDPLLLHGHADLSDYHGNTKDDIVDRRMTKAHSTPHLLNRTPLLISTYKSREMVHGAALRKRLRVLRGPCAHQKRIWFPLGRGRRFICFRIFSFFFQCQRRPPSPSCRIIADCTPPLSDVS